MSVWKPNFIWVSCGGLNNLSKAKWQGLKDRKVLIYPDANGISLWKDKVTEMRNEGVNAHLQTKWIQCAIPDDGDRYDIADVYLRLLQNEASKHQGKPVSTIPDALVGLDNISTYMMMQSVTQEMPF